MLAAGHVVKENYLSVVITFDFLAVSSIAWLFSRVDVNDFSVSLVAEKKAFIGVGIYPKVGRVTQITQL